MAPPQGRRVGTVRADHSSRARLPLTTKLVKFLNTSLDSPTSVAYKVGGTVGLPGEEESPKLSEKSKSKKAPRVSSEVNETGSRKVCLYLGDVAPEVDAASEKLGISRSRLLVRAWELAKARIAAIPGIPSALA